MKTILIHDIMKKLFTLISLFFGIIATHSASAQLSAGDIAFVQYNADGTDNFAFVALTDIPASSIIYFTDNEENNLSSGEGTLTWQAPAIGVSCGTVVTIDRDENTSHGTITNERNDFNLAGNGDAILAFQGPNNVTASTYIAAISNDGGSWGGSRDGNLPTGLTNETHAIAIDPEVDNVKYDGSLLSSSKAALLAAINDNDNWTDRDNDNQQTFSDTFTITECLGGACNISIATSNVSACHDNGTNSNSGDDTYTLDITINFLNIPTSGTLDLSGDVIGTYSIAVSSLSGSSHTFTTVVVSADGASKSVTASFSAESSCTDSETLSAVNSCSSIIPAGYIYFDNDAGDHNWNTPQNWSDNNVPSPSNDNIYIGAGFNVINNTGNDLIFDNGNDFQLFGSLDMNAKKLEVKTSGGYLLIGSTSSVTDAKEFYMTNADGLIENGASVETEHLKVAENSDFTIHSTDFNVSQKLELIDNSEIVGNGCVSFTGSDYTNTGNGIYGCTGSESACTNSGANDICSAGAFPVEYLSFEAEPTETGVTVSWATATESNNDFFLVQRSQNGHDWEAIEQVNGAGNSSQPIKYQVVDNQPVLGLSYYRLKQVDLDGAFSVSTVKQINVEALDNLEIKIYPNPISKTDELYIQIPQRKHLYHLEVILSDLKGQKVFSQTFSESDIYQHHGLLGLPMGLESGTYVLMVKSGTARSVQKVMVH